MYKYLGVKSKHECFIMDEDTCCIEVVERNYILSRIKSLNIAYNDIKLISDYKETESIDFNTLESYISNADKVMIAHTTKESIDCYYVKGRLEGLNIPVILRDDNHLYCDVVSGHSVYSIKIGATVYVYCEDSLYIIPNKTGFLQVGSLCNNLVILAYKYNKSIYFNDYLLNYYASKKMCLREFKRRVALGVL